MSRYREPINWNRVAERIAYGFAWFIASSMVIGGAFLLWIINGPGVRR